MSVKSKKAVESAFQGKAMNRLVRVVELKQRVHVDWTLSVI
jgi:hypothetical protein